MILLSPIELNFAEEIELTSVGEQFARQDKNMP